MNNKDIGVAFTMPGVSEIPCGLAEVVTGGVPSKASRPGPEVPDLDGMRVNSDFGSSGLVQEKQMLINANKPSKDVFVRVKSDPDMSQCYILHKDEETGSFHMVDPPLDYDLPNLGKRYRIHSGVTRNGEAFLWPVPECEPGSRGNSWNESHRLAAQEAKTNWVRVVPHQAKRAFVVMVAKGNLGEPVWPADDLRTQIGRAFAGRVINSTDHPVVRKLRGLE